MRVTKVVIFLAVMIFMFSLLSCIQMTGQEKDVLVKITARRIGFHGFKINPDMFTSLGDLAKQSCEGKGDKSKPIDIAFQLIYSTIPAYTKDPMLAQDLKDVAEIIGIKFDAAFTLMGLTEDKLKFIHLFICSFSQGIEAAKTTNK